MTILKILSTFLALMLCAGQCLALEYASKKSESHLIRLVVPFSAGTSIDTLARILAPELSKNLHKSTIVENKPGASGNIGTMLVKNAEFNESTLLVTASTIVTNYLANPESNVNPLTQLLPIALIATNDLVLVVPQASSITNTAMLLTTSREHPELMSYGSPGIGTPHYRAMQLLERNAHVSLLHVPFKDSASAISSLLGGQVDAMFLPINTAKPLIESGKIRALGIASNQRSNVIKAIPTFKEQGVAGVNCPIWYGIFAPEGLSEHEQNQLGKLLTQVLANPAIKVQIEQQGLTPKLVVSSKFKTFIESDIKLLGN